LEVQEIWQAVRRFWVMVLFGTVALGVLAGAYSAQRVQVYAAKSALLIRPLVIDEGSGNPDRYLRTKVDQMSSTSFIEDVSRQVPATSSESIRLSLQIVPRANSDIADISVLDTDAVRARRIADAVGTVFLEGEATRLAAANQSSTAAIDSQIKALNAQIADIRRTNPGIDTVDPRVAALYEQLAQLRAQQIERRQLDVISLPSRVLSTRVDPVRKRTTLYVGLGTVLGIVSTVGLAVLLTRGPMRLVTGADVQRTMGVAPTARIARYRRAMSPMRSLSEHSSEEQALFEQACTAASRLKSENRVIVVAGLENRSGVTTTVLGVAGEAVAQGDRALIMDLNPFSPFLSSNPPVDSGEGIEAVLRPGGIPRLLPTPLDEARIVAMGPDVHARGILNTRNVGAVIAAVHHIHKDALLIIDAGNLLSNPLAIRAIKFADAIVLITPESYRSIRLLQRAQRILSSSAAEMMVVIKGWRSGRGSLVLRGRRPGAPEAKPEPAV
jgi:capsular polysaccharide biosynthesis protein